MTSMMLFGFAVRLVQSLAQAAPFILTGFFIAAVFRRFIGYEKLRQVFGGSEMSSLFRAWVIGMLLPVCSLGVIPVIVEMRRAGIKGGTILAFAMSAPLFNPLSLLYGLTLSEPIAILSFAACSLVIVTVVGMIWDRIFPGSELTGIPDESVHYGIRRMAALGVSAGKEATGRSLKLVVAGLIGVGLLGAVIPHSSLQHQFNYDQPLAPLKMAALGIPVYATPMLAMSQMGMMFQHANSIGAAFVLLALGAGMNMGLIVWMLGEYGLKRSSVWMSILLVVVVGLGYAVDKPLFPKDIEPANHTHAFDIYGQPFSGSTSFAQLATQSAEKLKRDILPYEWYSLELLALLMMAGCVIHLVDRSGRIEAWIAEVPEPTETSRMDIVVPPTVLGGLALVGLVIFSGVGCYAYYPPANEVFEEIDSARVNALSPGSVSHVVYHIDVYQEWTRKLEVGTFLRTGQLTDYQRWKARLVREHLEMLKHCVEDSEHEEARAWVAKIQRSHNRMRDAFLNQS
ncbi:MAG: permease [Planctomycetaceae bacterium]